MLASKERNLMSKGSVGFGFGPDHKAPIFGINVKNTSINTSSKPLIFIFFLLTVTLLICGIFGLYHLLTHQQLESKRHCEIDTKSYEEY